MSYNDRVNKSNQGLSLGVETDERIVAEIQKKKDDYKQTKEDLEE